MAFSPFSTAGGIEGLGLAPLMVAEQHRGQGIGSRLVKAGLAAARQAGYSWVAVLGDPGWYRRFGFLPASSFGLVDAYGGGDAFQVIALQPGGIPMEGGRLSYAPEFALLA